MKKLGKFILGILILATVGLGGYTLGAQTGNTTLQDKKTGDLSSDISRPIDEMYDIISKAYLFDINEDKVKDEIYKGLFRGLDDPYSVYYNPEEYQELMSEASGTYTGIGVVVNPSQDNFIQVVSPFKGSPGEQAGLLPGDKIIAVNGVNYTASDMEEAVRNMKGEPNTDVTLTIRRDKEGATSDTMDIVITRQVITIETVASVMMDDNIGYLQISQFDEKTYSEFVTNLQSLLDNGAKAIVMDLRNNPGGLLSSTLEVADKLLGEGIIVSTVDKEGNRTDEKSDADKVDIPMTVLINGNSASASEILSGALKDHKRATVVGTTSFGKGIVQRIFPIASDGPGFKLTVQEYYTPNDTKIHGVGVIPDVDVPMEGDGFDIGPDHKESDVQLQKAIELLQ